MLILHMKRILPKSSQHSAEFPIVCMIIYGWIQSTAVYKRQVVRWCSFRGSIPSSIDHVWKSCAGKVISTSSCSYCIWNRYYRNHRSILPNILLFVSLYTFEFNRLPCPNDKMYDDVVFADRFRSPLTMFGNRLLIRLSILLHGHIAYETDTAKASQHFAEFPVVCMIWHGRIQSSAMFEQQDIP